MGLTKTEMSIFHFRTIHIIVKKLLVAIHLLGSNPLIGNQQSATETESLTGANPSVYSTSPGQQNPGGNEYSSNTQKPSSQTSARDYKKEAKNVLEAASVKINGLPV